MFDWIAAFHALGVLLAVAFVTWLVSLARHDVSIVDSVWSIFFLAALLVYAWTGGANGLRWVATSVLIGLWAVRLSVYLTWRNWGKPEDRRYRAIRERNQPRFGAKSLVIVFALQAGLAWVIALPILPVLKSTVPWSPADGLGVLIFGFGLVVETVADWQLARFQADPANRGRVMDRGFWRYSRHPNYFGECCIWWGFYLLAVGASAPGWTIVSPLLISFLLLKISGVPLLEKDIDERRPGYREYIARTSAFLPWPPRSIPEGK